MITVCVTLDFFLQSWDDPNGAGRLWLCFQPHVDRVDLAHTIEFIDQTANFSFQFTRRMNGAEADRFVPVSFPSDANLELILTGRDGFERKLTLNRTAINNLTEEGGAELLRLNLPPQETNGTSKTENPPPGPFAVGYNTNLKAQWTALLNDGEHQAHAASRMEQMLRAGFWGGTRRWLPTEARFIENLNLDHLMQLDTGDRKLLTNLHGLCGSMICVGTRAEAPQLSVVENLILVLRDGAGSEQSLDASHSNGGPETVRAFFSTLASSFPASLKTHEWNQEFSRRVYVTQPLMVFSARNVGGEIWYRRRTEEEAGHGALDGTDLSRLVARFTEAPATAPPLTLQWSLHDSFEVNIEVYRDARATGGEALLHVTPASVNRQRFYQELRAHDAAWFSSANGPVFYGSNGNRLSLRFVDSGDFPWDEETITFLYYGPRPAEPAATMVVARPQPNGLITTTFKPGNTSDDPWGPRYESADLSGAVTGSFTFLRLDPALSPDDRKRLAVGVAFDRQLNFEPAHSIANIEGNLKVRYPKPSDPATPADITAAQEYLHDLLNHNALNVYAPEHLNPATELYPVTNRTVNVNAEDVYQHSFHFRFPQTLAPEGINENARKFYQALYGRLGQPRPLRFTVEHTYGTELPLVVAANVHAAVTFRPSLPNEVSLTEKARYRLVELSSPVRDHFCSVILNETQPESVTLRFQLDWLAPGWQSDSALFPVHSLAWKSLYELQHAATIRLLGRFLRFDFHHLLDYYAASSDEDEGGFAAGLKEVDQLENWKQDITNIVKQGVARWVSGDLTNGDLLVTLTLPAGLSLADRCTVVQFSLEVERPASMLPVAGDTVALKQPKAEPQPADDGQKMTDIVDPRIVDIYQGWRESLRQRRRPLEPFTPTAKEIRLLLGSLPEDRFPDESASAWIAPAAIAAIEGPVIASICPLSFLPLERHANLGDSTYALVSTYCWALDIVLRAAVKEIKTLDQWKAYFTLLRSNQAAIESLIEKLVALCVPLPNSDAAALPVDIKDSVRELRRQSQLRDAVRAWLRRELWEGPALFGDAKALLYSRLRADSADRRVSADLVRLNSDKRLDRTDPKLGVTEQSYDRDRFTIRESLRTVHAGRWFGFTETLDNLRYSNQFRFSRFSLSSLEGMVEQVRNPTAAEPSNTLIPVRSLFLPAGPTPATIDEDHPTEPVRLASRQPVTTPVCHFCGALEVMQDKTSDSQLTLVLASLLRGEWEPYDPAHHSSDTRIAKLIARTAQFDRTSQRDDFVLSALFSARGDEEATASWNEAFSNDVFYFSIQDHKPPVAPEPASALDTEIALFLQQLMQHPTPDLIDNLETATLRADVLDFFHRAIEKAPEPNLFSLTNDTQVLIKPDGASVSVEIRPAMHREAWLFHTGRASDPAHPDRTAILLLVNAEIPVWRKSMVWLRQGRNLDLDGGVHFSPEFASLSPHSAPEQLYQPVRNNESLSNQPPEPLLRATGYSVDQLVQLLLIDKGHLPSTASSSEWKRFHLSVTVRARQKMQTFSARWDEATGGFTHASVQTDSEDFSDFPLRNFRFRPDEPSSYTTTHSWLDDDVDEYLFDFQWSNGSNLQFLRLRDVPVIAQ